MESLGELAPAAAAGPALAVVGGSSGAAAVGQPECAQRLPALGFSRRLARCRLGVLLQQELCGATFFEVNLQRGREIFTQEQIRVAPSIHMYCNGLGRVSGVGFSGARVLSTMSDSLSKVLEPPRLAASRRELWQGLPLMHNSA